MARSTSTLYISRVNPLVLSASSTLLQSLTFLSVPFVTSYIELAVAMFCFGAGQGTHSFISYCFVLELSRVFVVRRSVPSCIQSVAGSSDECRSFRANLRRYYVLNRHCNITWHSSRRCDVTLRFSSNFLFVSSYWVLLTGALFDVTDNYNLPFFAAPVIALCGSLGMFALVLFQKLKTKDRKCDDDKKQ